MISGNGLKTIQDHPEKAWPEMVACNVEAMGEMLDDFRAGGRGRAALSVRERAGGPVRAGAARSVERASATARCEARGLRFHLAEAGRATTSSSACTAGRSTGTSGAS